MTNEKAPKSATNFICKSCDFVCRSTYEWNRHLMTLKHTIRTNTNESAPKAPKASCLCGKQYKHASSLWNHKKKCVVQNDKIAVDKDKLIEMLVEKNTELQSDMLDLLKKGTTTQNNNNTMNHSHNKTFNLNFFLNDTCKDAMNITDFVESIKIQLGDLDTIGESGFVSGITDIIVKELRTIDVSKRPVHCSDAKRETMYVRDADKWEKEDDINQKLNQMIDTLSHNNLKKLSDWKEAHPHSKDSTSVQSDQYNRIIIGALDTSKENNNKIIKNIAKEVKIGNST
jgi:hypothetical protein